MVSGKCIYLMECVLSLFWERTWDLWAFSSCSPPPPNAGLEKHTRVDKGGLESPLHINPGSWGSCHLFICQKLLEKAPWVSIPKEHRVIGNNWLWHQSSFALIPFPLVGIQFLCETRRCSLFFSLSSNHTFVKSHLTLVSIPHWTRFSMPHRITNDSMIGMSHCMSSQPHCKAHANHVPLYTWQIQGSKRLSSFIKASELASTRTRA